MTGGLFQDAGGRDGSEGRIEPAMMASAGASPLGNLSSLAFAGPGIKAAWLGCLLGELILRLDMPVAGHPPAHWLW
jgi:hypothetical protein